VSLTSSIPLVRVPPVVPAGTVYFVRHGLVHNPNRIAYGWLPRYRLAEEGRRQAEATADFLAERGVKAIFTSPLLRAVQTSRIIAARLPDAPVRRLRLMIESGLAHYWQGTPWSVLEQDPTGEYGLWRERASAVEFGETMAAMAARMQAAMARALRLSGGGPAICVSHRDPILAFRLAVEGRSFDELHTTPCMPASVTVVSSNGGHLRLVEYLEPHARP
jgi:broad specificity phosphatase PhoE